LRSRLGASTAREGNHVQEATRAPLHLHPMRRIPDAIVRAMHHDEATIERFWSHVSRDDSSSGCWGWHGCLKSDRYPTFFIGNHSIAAARIAWFAATGELPAGGRLIHVCGNEQCMRPSHLGWVVGRRTDSTLDALGDGYLTLSGVPMALEASEPRMPRVARGLSMPSEPSIQPALPDRRRRCA
jgi:hypothetical protein